MDAFRPRFCVEPSAASASILLSALRAIDCAYLIGHPEVPDLYASGVRYEREQTGHDDWLDVWECLRRGVGDCEDLACWRAAELTVRHGLDARPHYQRMRTSDPRRALYHVDVLVTDPRTGTVTVDDPSIMLGMR